MTALLLLLATARGQTMPDAETQRLLGPAPAEAPAAVAPPAPTGSLGLGWPLAGLAVGGALVYVARQRALSPLTPAAEVRVVGRAVLAKDSTVSMVEVRDAHGQWRRLLIGTGSQGPQLLTGLGVQAAAALPPTTADASFGVSGPLFDTEEPLLDDLPEVPAYAAPEQTAPVLTTPPPVRPREGAPERPPLARGAPPARSYADVAAALDAPLPSAAARSAVARPQQSQAAEPAPAPVTSAREVLAMIEREKRRRVFDD